MIDQKTSQGRWSKNHYSNGHYEGIITSAFLIEENTDETSNLK